MDLVDHIESDLKQRVLQEAAILSQSARSIKSAWPRAHQDPLPSFQAPHNSLQHQANTLHCLRWTIEDLDGIQPRIAKHRYMDRPPYAILSFDCADADEAQASSDTQSICQMISFDHQAPSQYTFSCPIYNLHRLFDHRQLRELDMHLDAIHALTRRELRGCQSFLLSHNGSSTVVDTELLQNLDSVTSEKKQYALYDPQDFELDMVPLLRSLWKLKQWYGPSATIGETYSL